VRHSLAPQQSQTLKRQQPRLQFERPATMPRLYQRYRSKAEVKAFNIDVRFAGAVSQPF